VGFGVKKNFSVIHEAVLPRSFITFNSTQYLGPMLFPRLRAGKVARPMRAAKIPEIPPIPPLIKGGKGGFMEIQGKIRSYQHVGINRGSCKTLEK